MTRYLSLLDAIFAKFSLAALLLGFVVFGFSAESVKAQQSGINTEKPAETADPKSDSKTDRKIDPKSDLKASLNDLLTLTQNEVQRLEKRHEQSAGLFKDGLISRVDFENSEKEVAEARAKVEAVTKQIALANQPAPVLSSVTDVVASNVAWSTGNSKIDTLIRHYAAQHGVDPYLIFCLMSQESGFTAGATSYKGAQGLMQLMPGTAARYGVTNPYDVAQNIAGGTRYLKDLLKMFNGRVDLALAGYNAGEGAVMKYGNTIPPYSETRNYVKLILQRYTKKTS